MLSAFESGQFNYGEAKLTPFYVIKFKLKLVDLRPFAGHLNAKVVALNVAANQLKRHFCSIFFYFSIFLLRPNTNRASFACQTVLRSGCHNRWLMTCPIHRDSLSLSLLLSFPLSTLVHSLSLSLSHTHCLHLQRERELTTTTTTRTTWSGLSNILLFRVKTLVLP